MKPHPALLSAASLCLAVFAAPLSADGHLLVRKWETEPVLKTPESVLFDAKGKVLYVSNIDGKEPWTKDGKGSIAKVGLNGKVIAAEWVTGLQAPKGMGLFGGRLYVADIDQVVVIDVSKSAITSTIAVEGAQKLNDITIDRKGVVYVSDSGAKRVYQIIDGKAAVWLDQLQGPNGVLVQDDTLYVLDAGGFYKVGPDKALNRIVDGMDVSTDGVEYVGNGDFIVSCWRGVIYYVTAKGEKQQLMDTRPREIKSADIGYDAKKRVVYVPTFFTNTVVAYELK